MFGGPTGGGKVGGELRRGGQGAVRNGYKKNPSHPIRVPKCVCLQVKKCWDLLDVVSISHRHRERQSRRRVFYGLCERAQDMSRHPALSCRWVDVGWPVNQVHVLLIGGEDLDGLTLTDADLVLFERWVVLADPHGGRDTITTTFPVLRRRRGKDNEKRTKRGGEHQEGGNWRKDGERGRGQLNTRLRCVYVGWVTVQLAATQL